MIDKKKSDDIKWLRQQVKQYTELLPLYQRYAVKLTAILQKATRYCAPLAVIQARPKSIASFAEKCIRKKEKYKDPVNQMTDLCGARVITRIPVEVRAVSDFIEKHFVIDWDNTIDSSQRLKPTEFGYRSTHYIVQFKSSVFPNKDVDEDIPGDLLPAEGNPHPLKAEIQVRTALEHVWADAQHELLYKSPFTVPRDVEREMAGLAAILEGADKDFARIRNNLQIYSGSYLSYMKDEQIREEIAIQGVILEYDRGNVQAAHRIGRLAIALGEFPKAVSVLTPCADTGFKPLLRDLGVALCKQYRDSPDCAKYKEGLNYLEQSTAPPCTDPDAFASLAGAWKGIDEEKARSYYAQALTVDPSDPYPLGNLLEYDLTRHKDMSITRLVQSQMEGAVQRCRSQADVGINLPWAFYDMGKFYLLLGRPYESIAVYAKAIQISTAEFMVETSLNSLERLDEIGEELPGHEWVKKLLLMGQGIKFKGEKPLERIRAMASRGKKTLKEPVVILAGGCDTTVERKIESYKTLLLRAFQHFRGNIISGGTDSGISRLSGDIAQKYCDAIKAIGYLPGTLPDGASRDTRYSEFRITAGTDFSILEALQYWVDIISSGIDPSRVKVLGINGGAIAAAEYHIALSLGAQVAVIENSGREAVKILTDPDWNTTKTLLCLPVDALTLEAFIRPGAPQMASAMGETVARAIHQEFLQVRQSSLMSGDLALVQWEKLPDNLKESNLQQADHIFEKLRHINCTMQKVTDRPVSIMTFTQDEIEQMAEMEHARFNVERFLDGWKRGEKRDVAKKISPYLVPWTELSEDVKEWDRDTVRKIPKYLAGVGLEIQRRKQKRKKGRI